MPVDIFPIKYQNLLQLEKKKKKERIVKYFFFFSLRIYPIPAILLQFQLCVVSGDKIL